VLASVRLAPQLTGSPLRQCQEVWGYRDPEGFGGLEVDEELKRGGL